MPPPPPILLLGLGNELRGDDALGPALVRAMRDEYAFPRCVEVEALGTPGIDLLPHILDRGAVVVVDAVDAPGEPGSVVVHRLEAAGARVRPRVEHHGLSLFEAVELARRLRRAPSEVVLIGAVPERLEPGAGLSDAVHSALPELQAAVLAELKRLGAMPVPCRADAALRLA
jgi:hydrogenase maturation protease